jgi:ubiquinone/menaquinone biosynthesis C-methylase UbiE/uncharacterized protein YbaR (Trm112 family)
MKNSLNLGNLIVCPICKSNLNQEKKSLCCNTCGTIYKIKNSIPQLLKSQPNIDDVINKKAWDRVYTKHKVIKLDEVDKQAASHYLFLQRYRKQILKGSYLDLGCGVTQTGLLLAKDGVKVIGIDLSVNAVLKSDQMFRKNKLEGVFIQANFLNLPLKSNSINFIYWGLAIEYVKDIDSAIQEAYRVLKPGGTIVAPFPILSLTNLTYQQLRGDIPQLPLIKEITEFIHIKIFKGSHLHYGYGQTLNSNQLKRFFQQTGFKNIKIDYFDTYYPIQPIPKPLRSYFQKLLKFRPFWPFAYIEARK